MERDGHPVGCREITDKTTEMVAVVQDMQSPKLTTGWYTRFLKRHPQIKIVKAQVLSKTRNGVDKDTVVEFFHELVHSMSMVDMDPSRIFNMDETSFSPSKTARKVVVHRTTKAVYAEESSAASHVTIVACVAADGAKIPPLFVLPRDRVSTDTCDSLTIPGAAVTTSEKGWTNSYICRKWLSMLNDNIPSTVQRPVLLILDGCSSHYSEYVYDEAKALDILLQFLPANSTHLFQPLDVTVFRPFKQAIRQAVSDVIWTDVTSISKQRAVSIACNVWTNSTSQSAIKNGFVCTGLCPLSLDKMMFRLSLFKQSDVPEIDVNETWIKRQAIVRDETLLLPPPKKPKNTKQKTLTGSGKIITSGYHDLLLAQAALKPKRKMSSAQSEMSHEVSTPSPQVAVSTAAVPPIVINIVQ
ncbi:hypothetical protein DYB25_005971 [Aphanomyces astaci]|uniref:HTH CENPB-type domain-containing protein n=1 Tax=Aphanomyces astaci TaxID=112090 RepID=A0A397BLX1_APHAT|nr:hypothetical protein DYB25_005971 [Aphanomyces astaci]